MRSTYALVLCIALVRCALSVETPAPNAAPDKPKVVGDLADILKPKGYIEVPLTLNGGGLLDVAIKINGQKLLFVVDSGACDTVIDMAVAKRLNLPSEKSTRTFAGVGGAAAAAADILTAERFSIGTLTARVTSFSADLTAVNAERKKDNVPPCDGLLGSNVLDPSKAIIDYAAHRLFLLDPGHK